MRLSNPSLIAESEKVKRSDLLTTSAVLVSRVSALAQGIGVPRSEDRDPPDYGQGAEKMPRVFCPDRSNASVLASARATSRASS
jgi:hypothetical protein